MTTDGATVGYLGVSRSLSGRAWRLRPAADSDVRGLQQSTGLSEPLARALASLDGFSFALIVSRNDKK